MLERPSCERRVYRLATLLTGNPKAAMQVIASVVGAQPDLRRLDSTHLDRLTVLRSRETRSGRLRHELVPSRVAKALSVLTRQQRESWIFHYVYRLMPRDIAKSMDCSVRAVQLHLTSAEGAMNDALGRGRATQVGQELLAYTMRLDVPEFYRAKVRHQATMRLVIRFALIALLAVVLAGIFIALKQTGVIDTIFGKPG